MLGLISMTSVLECRGGTSHVAAARRMSRLYGFVCQRDTYPTDINYG